MRQVKCDAPFDVVPKAEVAKRCQGNIKDDDDAHANVQGLWEAPRVPHLVLQRENLDTKQNRTNIKYQIANTQTHTECSYNNKYHKSNTALCSRASAWN